MTRRHSRVQANISTYGMEDTDDATCLLPFIEPQYEDKWDPLKWSASAQLCTK